MRSLIVNADDFGFTRDVNAGIVEAHRQGIVTATTLMAFGSAFNDAVRLSQDHPTLDIGCHLVLVGSAGFPETPRDLVAAVALRRINPEVEMRRQIEKIVAAGVRPTHLDTHKHTHVLPPVFAAVLRLSREFKIPWVRRPILWPRALVRPGLARMTDHFLGFRETGSMNTAGLVSLIHKLPEGLSELMCHPGHCTPELEAAATRLKQSRQQELEALTAPEVRAALGESKIHLTTYEHQGI